MSAVDLQRRLTRAMERGRGSMMITQTDLGVLLESGAYEAVCSAATAELKQRAIKNAQSSTDAAPLITPQHVTAEMEGANNSFPKRKPGSSF